MVKRPCMECMTLHRSFAVLKNPLMLFTPVVPSVVLRQRSLQPPSRLKVAPPSSQYVPAGSVMTDDACDAPLTSLVFTSSSVCLVQALAVGVPPFVPALFSSRTCRSWAPKAPTILVPENTSPAPRLISEG